MGAAALAAVLVAACGGGDGPTRAQFAKRADAICAPALKELRAVSAQIDEVAAGAEPGPIFSRSATLIRRGQSITARTFDRIDALDPPAADRDAIKAWVADNRRQSALSGQLASAFETQDQKRIALVAEEIDALDTKSNRVAARLGMRACAERI